MEETTQCNKKELRIILDSNEVKNYFQKRNVKIKEEVVSDDEPTDLQPDSQVYSQEYQIKSEVVDSSTLPSVKQLEDEHEHTQKLFSCSLCKRNNMLRISFKQHLINVHRLLNNEEILKYVPEFYQCKYCHHQFETPARLHQHEGSHTLPFKCDMCDKRYGQKQSLQRHKLAHSESQIPCPHCDKKYRQKTRLTDHIESLHSVHKCDQCQKKFKCRKYPMEHIKYIHNKTNRNSWKCDECGKYFQFKSKLEKHILYVHKTVSKNFFCLHCNMKFKLNSSLKHQIKIKHNSFVRIDCSLNPRNCPKTCNEPNSEGLSKPVGQSFELQNQHVKEEISEDVGPVIQQISDVYMEHYQEENIITEVNYRLESTMNDKVETTDENDVEIKTEITIDEMDRSILKTEESTEKGHSVSSQSETLAYKQEQEVIMEGITQDNKKELSFALDSNEVKNSCKTQNVEIKEEVVCDDEPTDLQPISQVCVQEYKYEIKSEVDSTALPRMEQLEDKNIGTKTCFSCSLCKRKNMVLSIFKQHLTRTHHLSKEEVLKYVPEFYDCKYCHRQYKNPSALHQHIGSHALPYKCDICDNKFGQAYSLKVHKLMHSEPQFPCPHCDKKFRRKIHLTNHISMNHSKDVYKCDHCGHYFISKCYLTKHIIAVHNTIIKNYLCSFCGETFKGNQNLKHHINTMHNSGVSIKSNDCSLEIRNLSKTFNYYNAEVVSKPGVSEPVSQSLKLQNQNLKVKEEISEDDGPKLQPMTEVYLQEYRQENIKTEVNSTTLAGVEHLADKHNGTKTLFSCSLCKEERLTYQYYKSHLTNVHFLLNEEISKYIPEFYQCKYCQLQFKLPYLLHNHEGSHTLPFKCDICDKRFGQKYYLKSHQVVHSEPQFPCPHCDKTFRRKDTLTNHLESIHRDGDVHKCDQCEKKYKCRRFLLHHIRKHHNITHGNVMSVENVLN